MNTFAVVVLCLQACLVQNVLSQCTSRAAVVTEPALIAPAGLAAPCGLNTPFAYDGQPNWAAMAPASAISYNADFADYSYPDAASWAAPYGKAAAYGGAGEGNVAVAGELPVAGNTVVAGRVPITGAVRFGGDIPAAGAVSISGRCACGCGSSNIY